MCGPRLAPSSTVNTSICEHALGGSAFTLAPLDLQRELSAFNRARLAPALPSGDDLDQWLACEARMRRLEHAFVERERHAVRDWARQAPTTPGAFVEWFEQLETSGPGQHDPLFAYLAHECSREEMRWFLTQEMAGEAGFDDLVALAQIKLPLRPKLELARNYWDEMGRGHASGVHGELLARLGVEQEIAAGGEVVWESLALGNIMIALACNRHYAYHAIGALGVIELTAPGRAVLVNEGLRRLGVDGEARRYFALHATLDVKHSAAWNREVIAPLVAENAAVATAIAEGALLRLRAGERCFERYRSVLGLSARATSMAARAMSSV